MPVNPKLRMEEGTAEILQKISGKPRFIGVTPEILLGW